MVEHKFWETAIIAGLLGAAVFAAGNCRAEEVYRSVDADGVTSFTDFPVAGAEKLRVDPVAADADAAAASAQLIEQQLAVAKALEESRLARRAADNQRLAALAARGPRTVYYEVPRETYYGGYFRHRRPGYGHRPGRPGFKPGRPGHPGYGGRPGAGHPDGGGRPGSRSISRPMIMRN